MAPRKIRFDRREQCRERGLGDVGEHRAGLEAVEGAAQQLDADLKPALASPAPQSVEGVLKVGGAGEQLVEIGGKPGPVRQRCEEPFG